MFNARLLLDGFAQVMTVPPNVKYADMFVKFQQEAREAGKGLWFAEPGWPPNSGDYAAKGSKLTMLAKNALWNFEGCFSGPCRRQTPCSLARDGNLLRSGQRHQSVLLWRLCRLPRVYPVSGAPENSQLKLFLCHQPLEQFVFGADFFKPLLKLANLLLL